MEIKSNLYSYVYTAKKDMPDYGNCDYPDYGCGKSGNYDNPDSVSDYDPYDGGGSSYDGGYDDYYDGGYH
jgi:hypothetical protein